MSKMPSVQEMIFDLWSCLIVDSNTGEKYLRIGPDDENPPIPSNPNEDPENPEDPGENESDE